MSQINRVERPGRWDAPFDPNMSDSEVGRILAVEPFRSIDPQRFPANIPLRDLLLNDSRIRRFNRGEIIVQEGDYGSSAFFILSVKVRVLLGSGDESVAAAILGREEPKRKSWVQSFSQLWKNSEIPGYRAAIRHQALGEDTGSGPATMRVTGESATIFLQDIPGVLTRFKLT